jgi:hypothetical protein
MIAKLLLRDDSSARVLHYVRLRPLVRLKPADLSANHLFVCDDESGGNLVLSPAPRFTTLHISTPLNPPISHFTEGHKMSTAPAFEDIQLATINKAGSDLLASEA